MSDVSPYARVVDVRTGTLLASTTDILDYEITWKLSAFGKLKVSVPLGDPVAGALLAVANTPRPALLEFSLDGGTSFDSRKLVEAPQTVVSSTGAVTEDGDDLGSIYAHVGVDRVTFSNVLLYQVLNGQPGQIPVDGTGVILLGDSLPWVKGLFQTKPGRSDWADQNNLVFVPVVSTWLAGLLVSVDVNADNVANALDSTLRTVAGAYLPRDLAPVGTRQFYVMDPSDATLNLTGVTRGIAVGYLGTGAHLTFQNYGTPPIAETTT
ncbi:MAG: hypothetical protein KGK08_15155, partial [Acidobacteriota bacterium]|nr:hypothetical protein [Acidobacteriota bacterium]